MIRKFNALYHLFSGTGAESRVSKRWLFARSSQLDERFWLRYHAALTQAEADHEFRYIKIDNQVFVWPKYAPLRSLSQILSELLQPEHPHYYDCEPTRIQCSDVVLDIGACEGAFTAYAAEHGANVYAVEPSRRMTAVINRLFELRRLSQPTVIQSLLGQKPGEFHFIDDETNPGASRVVPQEQPGSYPVNCQTLDEFAAQHFANKLNFIKCDAEGWDYDILASGENCLRRFRPKIAVTTYHNPQDYERMSAFLEPLGYQCFPKGLLLVGDRFRPMMLHAVAKNAT